jgi:hypothetical protein
VCILNKLNIERLAIDWNLCVFASATASDGDRLCFKQRGKCRLMAMSEQQSGLLLYDTAFVINGQVLAVPRAELQARSKWAIPGI